MSRVGRGHFRTYVHTPHDNNTTIYDPAHMCLQHHASHVMIPQRFYRLPVVLLDDLGRFEDIPSFFVTLFPVGRFDVHPPEGRVARRAVQVGDGVRAGPASQLVRLGWRVRRTAACALLVSRAKC